MTARAFLLWVILPGTKTRFECKNFHCVVVLKSLNHSLSWFPVYSYVSQGSLEPLLLWKTCLSFLSYFMGGLDGYYLLVSPTNESWFLNKYHQNIPIYIHPVNKYIMNLCFELHTLSINKSSNCFTLRILEFSSDPEMF